MLLQSADTLARAHRYENAQRGTRSEKTGRIANAVIRQHHETTRTTADISDDGTPSEPDHDLPCQCWSAQEIFQEV